MLKERCGNSLGDQRLAKMVLEKAEEITAQQRRIIEVGQVAEIEVKAAQVDLYEAKSEEIIWLADGICVSEQKAKRNKKPKVGKERTATEMAMRRRRDGSYKTLVAGAGVERVEYYQKEANEKIINLLWEGETVKVVAYLGAMASKNESKQRKLLGCLEKNEDYIINYGKRCKAGRIIENGRMEKQNDVVVAYRQKRKEMSWSKQDSRNLAMVTASLNQRTNYLQ